MKRLAFAAILSVSCSSTICPDDKSVTRPALAGQYFLGAPQATCFDTEVPPATMDTEQHHLTLASDRKTVSETFMRDGKTYVVEYDVVSIKWGSL